MADIYCDFSNGDDGTGDGSSGNPYKTTQVGVDNASGGDTVWVGDTAADVLAATIDWVSFGGGTSADAPIIIRGWDYSGGAGVEGTGEIDGNNAVANIFSTTSFPSHFILVSMRVHNTTGVVVDAGNDAHIIDCEIYNGGSAKTLDVGTRGSVIGCNIHTGTSGANAIVAAGAVRVLSNRITGHDDGAIQISGNDSFVCGNLIHDVSDHGIEWFGSERLLAMNNTITGDGTADKDGMFGNAAGEVQIIVNNIISGFSGTNGNAIDLVSGGNCLMLGHNLMNGNTNNAVANETVFGLDLTASDSTADPSFENAGSDIYEVGTNAKAIGYPSTLKGSSTVSYVDVGAAQREETAGGGGGGLKIAGSGGLAG